MSLEKAMSDCYFSLFMSDITRISVHDAESIVFCTWLYRRFKSCGQSVGAVCLYVAKSADSILRRCAVEWLRMVANSTGGWQTGTCPFIGRTGRSPPEEIDDPEGSKASLEKT
ncbi:hypothetical protein Tamer19_07310 [Cupriavidus sp. TA19]|uniref:hypothetical protein n=1 Tax=Cupriavidus sp. TA19 TaxID=701108 RepID=UPI0027294E52|nr:hypothetical protein [Cupriavidus sp. TA19]GLC91323.1 hypothetical protein Tamer19_07310 [Cupriavidus sp. TA19]